MLHNFEDHIIVVIMFHCETSQVAVHLLNKMSASSLVHTHSIIYFWWARLINVTTATLFKCILWAVHLGVLLANILSILCYAFNMNFYSRCMSIDKVY